MPEGKDGKQYYLPDDMTDKAIEWLHAVRAQDATKPWMMYFSTGAATRPHHVAKEWADKYKGQFDQGWDKLREQTFARQKKLGIIPENTELTARPDVFPAWDSLTDAQKKLYARQAEVFAGYSENADWNVGRVLDAVEKMGDLDNTLVIYIWGDNGASMEGTITGSFNEMTTLNGLVIDADQQLELIEQYGGVAALGGAHRAALRGGLGARDEHAVPVGQADRQPPRRHAACVGHRPAVVDVRRCAPPRPGLAAHHGHPEAAGGGDGPHP